MRVLGFPFRLRIGLGVSQVLPAMLVFGAVPCAAQSLFLNHSFEVPDGPYPQHWEPHPYRNPARTDVAHINGTDAADGEWYARVVALDYLSGYFYFGWTPSDTNYEILPAATTG